MKRLTLIWHSRTGTGQQVAQAVARGAAQAEGGLALTLLPADQAQPDHLLQADGYVFIAPENLGSLSGAMKEFFDRCYYPVLDRLNGRPYLLIVCAGSDGQGAVRQTERILTGWRLKRIAPASIVHTQAQRAEEILAPKTLTAQQRAQTEEAGACFAAGLVAGIY
jgi:NAD(P)H-dependent FMN reductase